MREKIKNVDAPVSNESWMILKPPQALLEVKPEAYYPKLVTIGPLYPNLEPSPINNFKAQCVKKFMERHGISGVGELTQYLSHDQADDELSRIYNLNLPQSDFEWLQLLVTVDTIFIHEYLQKIKYFRTFHFNDHTFRVRLDRDLLLIGNQIPMAFLKKIANNGDFSLADFEKAVRAFIVRSNPFFHSQTASSRFLEFLDSGPNPIKLVDICKHLLDCLYLSCTLKEEESTRQSNSEEPTSVSVYSCFSFLSRELEAPKKDFVRLPTTSQLYKAGIRFKACDGNISVMKYDKTKLQLHLPRLIVYEGTEDVLRNLLAYEQTSKEGGEFTMYAVIMDSLIDTTEDLAILTKARVIVNHLGSDDELVQMWNNMSKNVTIRSCKRLDDIMHDVLKHYRDPWSSMYVEFREKYFSRPWLTISLIVAFLLLLCSLVQTCYTVAGYYRSKH